MRRRGLGIFLICAAAASLAVAATAWACGNLATLTASPKLGAAGSSVTVSGTNYKADAGNSGVEIRLDTRDGTILGTVPLATIASGGGSFSNVPVTIPANASAGYHLLLGVQTTSTGAPVRGTPGRTTFRVTGTSSSSSLPVSPWSSGKEPSGPGPVVALGATDSGGPALLTLLVIAMSLGLLGTGLKLLLRGAPKATNHPLGA